MSAEFIFVISPVVGGTSLIIIEIEVVKSQVRVDLQHIRVILAYHANKVFEHVGLTHGIIALVATIEEGVRVPHGTARRLIALSSRRRYLKSPLLT